MEKEVFKIKRIIKKKQVKEKTIFLSVISLFLGLFFFSGFFMAAPANRIPEPNAGEKALLWKFAEFDRMYYNRQLRYVMSGDKWVKMGDKINKERITVRLQQNYDVGINFFLRAALIEGECYLFASQEYFRANKKKEFLEFYERGIKTLERVIIETDKIAESQNKPKSETIYLPPYSSLLKKRRHNDFNLYGGCETIGTGFEETIGVICRKVTYDINNYYDLDKYRSVLLTDTNITQISTTQTARTLLSHFCPWGVQIYTRLKEANLTSNIDFRILRPYAKGLDKPLHQKVFNNIDWLLSSRRTYLSSYISMSEVSPIVSDISVSSDKVPIEIKKEMDLIVGEETGDFGQKRTIRNNSYRIHRGTKGILRNKPIKWLWVGDPTYNIWYISPTLYNWKASDYAKVLFTLYKWANGGLVWGAVSIAMDYNASSSANLILSYFNLSPVPIPFVSNFLTEVTKDQYKGKFWKIGKVTSVSDTINKKKWFDLKGLFMDLTLYIFESMEKSTQEGFFGRINPEEINIGSTYDGAKIPPILLCANVTGFQEVPDTDYPKYITVVRFYTVFPKIDHNKVIYDLRNLDLLESQPKKPTTGWSKLDSPFGSYEIITSFAPGAQFLKFELDPKTAKFISDSDRVEMEIWTTKTGEKKRKKYATAYIKPEDKNFTLRFFNKEYPLAEKAYKEWLAYPNAKDRFIDRVMEATRSPDRISQRDAKAQKGEYHTALVPLKTKYELKVKINGKPMRPEEERYLINLYSGLLGGGQDPNTGRMRRPKQPITGELSVYPSNPTYQQLDYDRKIKLNVGEIKWKKVVPSPVRKNQDRE